MTALHASKPKTDALVIGGGHNGLVCAFYLAAQGLSVTVLESRSVVGGAAVTEEFHPGFRNSIAAYTVSLLHPRIIRDLDLYGHGLRIVERKMANFLPLDHRRFFKFGGPNAKEEIAKFSACDAARFDSYTARLDVIADVMRHLALRPPPNIAAQNWLGTVFELSKSDFAHEMRRIGMHHWPNAWRLFTQSAGAYLDRWFESDPLKAALGWDSIVGNYASPYTKGSAYVLLHHVFGEVNGKKGAWGHAIGGMGAITQAMAKAARIKGAVIRTDCRIVKILIENDRAAGVVTEKGEELRADIVVSNLNPKLSYQLVDPVKIPAAFRQHMDNWRCGSGTFRMNVALAELPRFTCLPEAGDHHTAGILIAPDLAYMDRAYKDALRHGWSQKPVVELVIPSTLDDSLAPPGRHVASLFCQHVAPVLPNGGSWDTHKDAVARLMIKTVNDYAPNFENSILGMQVLSPLDLERTFGLVGGDIFHGALGLDQLYHKRPMQGYADYRGPLGIYMCGSGTHPGGGVTGAPGHNAAQKILRDILR
jgi:phytoene dehydrogenase-like protein